MSTVIRYLELKLHNFTSFCNNRLGAICKEIPAYAGMTKKGCGYAPVGGQGTVPRLYV